MRTITFLLIFLLFTLLSSAQSTFTISGKITDARTGEDLIAASVLIPERNVGAVSNSYGFYSISLLQGKYTVRYSYVGYQSVDKVVDLDRNLLMNVESICLSVNTISNSPVEVAARACNVEYASPDASTPPARSRIPST